MNDDDVVVARASGREAVEDLRRSGALDALFERLDAGEVEMTGSQGLLPALLKEALERGLAAELTQHLGYEKGQTSAQARSNTRNGTTKKTVMSEVEPSRSRSPGTGQAPSPRAWYAKDSGASMAWIR